MSAKHTPGPWFLHTFDDGSMAIQPAVGFMVTPVKPRAGFEEDIPNFKLMAAAPDLLAALVGLVENQEAGWRATGTMPDEHIKAMPYLRAARAAIAKAKGGAK